MASLPKPEKLKAQLNTAKVRDTDFALFQVISQLIDALIQTQAYNNEIQEGNLSSFGSSSVSTAAKLAALAGYDYLTHSDETANLANSRELLAGTGLSFDDTVAGERTVGISFATDWDLTIVKVTDQDVTNSSTLVDDTELLIPVLAGEVWVIELLIAYSGDDATADYKFGVRVDAGTQRGTFHKVCIGTSGGAENVVISAVDTAATNSGVGTNATDGKFAFTLRGSTVVSADGNLRYQFAQNSTTAAKRVRTYAGSILRAKKLA